MTSSLPLVLPNHRYINLKKDLLNNIRQSCSDGSYHCPDKKWSTRFFFSASMTITCFTKLSLSIMLLSILLNPIVRCCISLILHLHFFFFILGTTLVQLLGFPENHGFPSACLPWKSVVHLNSVSQVVRTSLFRQKMNRGMVSLLEDLSHGCRKLSWAYVRYFQEAATRSWSMLLWSLIILQSANIDVGYVWVSQTVLHARRKIVLQEQWRVTVQHQIDKA